MYNSIKKMLVKWNASYDEREKLQHAYVALAFMLVIGAGLIGLINYDLSQQMTAIALLFLVMFVVNLVFWTLLQGIVLMRLDKITRTKKTTKKTKKS
jgi:tellurite resistance protein TehA-like permease